MVVRYHLEKAHSGETVWMQLVTLGAVAATGQHYEWFVRILHAYGYIALFGIICAQDLGIPTLVPGPIVLIAAGYLASTGTMNPVIAGLVAVVAAVLGASTLFVVSRLLGEAFFHSMTRLIPWTDERRARVDRFLRRWGLLAWLVFRCVPGFRTLLSLISGIGGIHYARFAFLTTLASVIWAYAFVLLGFFLGRHWHDAFGVSRASTLIALLLILLAAGAVVARRVIHGRSKPVEV
jgi:membrane protein DedA with SNARE-associated domain